MATSKLHPSSLVTDLGPIQLTGPVQEHLYLHLDATAQSTFSIDTSTASGNVLGNVTEWRNAWAGRNNQMVFLQDVALAQPTYMTGVVNGLNAVWFSGAAPASVNGNHMFCEGAEYPGGSRYHNISKSGANPLTSVRSGLPTGSGTDHYTAFVVVASKDNLTDDSDDGSHPNYSSGGWLYENNSIMNFSYKPALDQIRYYCASGQSDGGSPDQMRFNGSLYNTGTGGVQAHLITFTYDGSDVTGDLDGTAFDQDSPLSCELWFPYKKSNYSTYKHNIFRDGYTLGAGNGNTVTSPGAVAYPGYAERKGEGRGYFCETMLFDELLTATQIAEIQTALKDRWGTL